MLVCPECNAENRIGAIFCRECGEKLDVSDLRPPSKSEQGGRRWGLARIIRWLFSLAVLAALVYAVLAMLATLGPDVGGVERGRRMEVENDYQRVVDGVQSVSGRSLRLNSAEATYLLNEILGLDKDAEEASGAGFMAPVRIAVELLPDNEVKVMMRHRLFDQVDSDSMMIGKFTIEDGNVRFEPHTLQLGDLPIKLFLSPLVKGRFEQQFHDRAEMETAIERVQSLEIEENRVVIRIKQF